MFICFACRQLTGAGKNSRFFSQNCDIFQEMPREEMKAQNGFDDCMSKSQAKKNTANRESEDQM
jgi:hypothetical protein